MDYLKIEKDNCISKRLKKECNKLLSDKAQSLLAQKPISKKLKKLFVENINAIPREIGLFYLQENLTEELTKELIKEEYRELIRSKTNQ